MAGAGYDPTGGAPYYSNVLNPVNDFNQPAFKSFMMQTPGPGQLEGYASQAQSRYQQGQMFPLQLQQQQMKTNALGQILGSFGHNGWTTGFMNRGVNLGTGTSPNPYGGMVPSPSYGSVSSVYTPQQISSEANAQRANLYAQAQNANRQYAMQAGAAGYSPMSPLTQFMTNTNNMRVAGNAAQNETNLRFNAAQANTDAALKQQQVNAGLYDAYSRALGVSQGQENQLQLGLRGQNLDLLHYLLGALG